jgi:nitrate reductase gamma subunit
MTDWALFAASPRVALLSLGWVALLRYLLIRRRGPMPSSALSRAKELLWDSWPWRIGLVGLLVLHLVLLAFPMQVLASNRVHGQLLALEAAGCACGLLALVGIVSLIRRRLRTELSLADAALLCLLLVEVLSGLAMAGLYRWASSWSTVTLVPYVRSLLTLDAHPALMTGMPYVPKLHVFCSIALLAVLPFSHAFDFVLLPVDRAVTALLAPLAGARRRAWRTLRALGRRGAVADPASASKTDKSRINAKWMLAGGAGALGVALLAAGVGRELSLVGVHQGYAPEQPIAFSHQLHAGDNKIACLYCHFAATKSRHAGIPPANVCMNCHAILRTETAEIAKLKEAVAQNRPIEWIKVHNLPDFVYFNHSQHVLSSVACRECHGAVETMTRVRQEKPLTMGWCLDCHRHRSRGPAVPQTAVAGLTSAPPGRGANVALAASQPMASDPRRQPPLPGLECGKCHY